MSKIRDKNMKIHIQIYKHAFKMLLNTIGLNYLPESMRPMLDSNNPALKTSKVSQNLLQQILLQPPKKENVREGKKGRKSGGKLGEVCVRSDVEGVEGEEKKKKKKKGERVFGKKGRERKREMFI